MTSAHWTTALAQGGDFSEVADAAFLAAYLGIDGIRLTLIRALRRRGAASLPDLARELEWTRNGLKSHLEVLEDLGIVRRFTTRVPGVFRPVTCFHLDEARTQQVADALASAMRG